VCYREQQMEYLYHYNDDFVKWRDAFTINPPSLLGVLHQASSAA
jgi:hypothetical protein